MDLKHDKHSPSVNLPLGEWQRAQVKDRYPARSKRIRARDSQPVTPHGAAQRPPGTPACQWPALTSTCMTITPGEAKLSSAPAVPRQQPSKVRHNQKEHHKRAFCSQSGSQCLTLPHQNYGGTGKRFSAQLLSQTVFPICLLYTSDAADDHACRSRWSPYH